VQVSIQVIAVDGKLEVPMSESLATFCQCVGDEHRLVLAQSKVQDKSNEITSLPYWNCLTLKAVLSPLMPWAKTIAAQIQRAQADTSSA